MMMIIIIIIIIMSNWNHFKITQTIPKQHTGRTRNQGNTKNSHIGHRRHTTEGTDVEVQMSHSTVYYAD